MTEKRSIQDPSAAALGEKPDTHNETAIPIGSTRRRKPRRTARGPKPPALADSATIIAKISGVIDTDDPTKKPNAEQKGTPTSNAEISVLSSPSNIGDTERFHQHVHDCPECERGGGRDGRLCPIGALLARPPDLRLRARAPKLRPIPREYFASHT